MKCYHYSIRPIEVVNFSVWSWWNLVHFCEWRYNLIQRDSYLTQSSLLMRSNNLIMSESNLTHISPSFFILWNFVQDLTTASSHMFNFSSTMGWMVAVFCCSHRKTWAIWTWPKSDIRKWFWMPWICSNTYTIIYNRKPYKLWPFVWVVKHDLYSTSCA